MDFNALTIDKETVWNNVLMMEAFMNMNEAAAYARQEEVFNLFTKLSDCIVVVNQIGRIIFLNPNAENMFRIKFHETKGKTINKLIPNYQSDKTAFMGIRKDGLQFPITVASYTISFEKELYNVILVDDPLEDKKRLKVLTKELADINFALDASTIVAITDHNGTITLVNDKFCELSLYSRDELIGQNHRIVNSGYHTKEFFQEMWRTISSGEIWNGEIQNKTKDGRLYWVDTTIVPFMDDKGLPYQYISIRTDITKRVNMEIKLREAMKNDFMYTVQNLQNGIFKMKKDEDGDLVYTMAEGKLMDEIGVNSQALFKKTPYEAFPKEIAAIKQFHYEKAFEGNRVNYEIELSGKLLYVDVSPIKQGDTVFEIVGSVHDITELRTTQRELQENQQHYQSLFEHSQDYVITYDTNGKIINMNPKAKEIFGCSKEASYEKMIVKEYLDLRNHCFQMAVHGNPQNLEIEKITKNGEKIFFNLNFLPIIVDKQIKGVYSIGKDITEQKKIQEMNAYLAHHDELTNLPNRRWIEQKTSESLLLAEKNKHRLAVLFIDLDRFKNINDTLGHFIGDQLLIQVSERLLESVNEENHYVARMGGDEFMVLCPVIEESNKEGITVAENILQKLSSHFYIEDFELFVTASIGISIYPLDGGNVVDLMKKADIALYRAKDQGRNTYQIYSTNMDERSYQSFLLERNLRKAIINNEFIAHFQPKVDAQTGKIIGAEALIRWKHPEVGLIPPGEFIPLAEESGLIIPMGKWMKRRVCEQLAVWREAGIPLIPISINISSQRFLQKDFASDVRQLLEEFQLDGKWIEFEITENSLMKNEEYIIQTINELKELGIKIFIDDFGTGYSSFNYLKLFKLDGIKIDRSFIRNISCQSENAGITIAMIKMAQHLKMDVIAEGVETEDELLFLLEQNCHQIQGFLFGKPCSSQKFEQRFLLE